MERKKSGTFIAKSISGIMLCTFAFKLLGFIRELVLSYYFGTSGISDAYLISQSIPSIIFDFVGAGISTCFIPIYFKVLNNRGKQETYRFTNKITTLTIVFSSVVIGIVLAFAPYIVKLFASGFSGETLNLATGFTRICILSLYFSTFVFIYGAYLQANDKFMPNVFSSVILSACILVSIILGAKYNVWIMSIGSCLAVGIRLLFIIPAAHKIGLQTKINFQFNDVYVKEFFILMIPIVLGTSVNEINTLIDRTIASRLAVGGISALTYSNSMLQLATGGIVQPFSTVVYPQITDLIHNGEKDNAIILFSKMINVLLLLLIPITVGILIFSKSIIQLLFARGAFDEQALNMTSDAFRCYAIGLCFIGLREMISRFYYACENTKLPMINSSIGMGVNILLNLILSRIIGLRGLALATSISAIVTTILLWISMYKKLRIDNLKINIFDLIKIVISAVAMGIISLLVYRYIFFETKIGLVISILLAILIYFVFIITLKVESVMEGKRFVKNFFNKHSL